VVPLHSAGRKRSQCAATCSLKSLVERLSEKETGDDEALEQNAERGESVRFDQRVILIHTRFMKVAISVPEPVFREAEEASKRLRMSRSRLYSQALAEFVKKHRGQSVREALDAVYSRESSDLDPVLTDLQARALREKW
jgi:hypothetical protein